MESPVLELNKENAFEIVKSMSKGDMKTVVSAFSLMIIFKKMPEEIEIFLDELVEEGRLTREDSELFKGVKGYVLKDG